MKKFVLLICLLGLGIGLDAQESYSFNKGYRGDVSVGGIVGVTKGVRNDAFSLSTVHGYSYGDGLFVGGGVGLNALFSDLVTVPVFAVAKYNFIDKVFSPFVDCRLGAEAMLQNNDKGLAFVVSPGVGVDFKRVNFRVAYLCEAGKFTERFSSPEQGLGAVSLFRLSSFQITVGVSF